RVGVALRHVSGTPGDYPIVDLATGNVGECLDHFEHAVATTGAEVHRQQVRLPLESLERGQVSLSEIHDVDVVPNAGPIGGRIVRTVNGKLRQDACRDLGNIRHQVVRRAARIFTDQSGFMGTDRVEVTQ